MNHYRKKQLIRAVAPWINRLQLPRFFEPTCSGMGHILTFHRVVPDSAEQRIHNHESLEVSPTQLRQTIEFYRDKGYAFYSLDQVYEALQRGNSPQKFVAFTFDDGYLDNYTIAYPILREAGVPFCIYVCTDFPDRKAIVWWYLLEEMIQAQEEIQFDWQGQSYHFASNTQAEKEQAFSDIRQLINQSFHVDHWAELLKAIFSHYPIDLYAYTDQLAMSWDHIRTINRDPLVTIGAHTLHHYPLIQLSEEAAIEEIQGSKRLLEQALGQPVEHFAYPFGKAAEVGSREFDLVRNMGFKTATTTRMGNIFPQHRAHLECLPRISLNRASSPAVLQLQSSGLLPFLFHKGQKVITH